MKKEKKTEIWASVLREANNDDRPKCPLYEDSKQPVQPPIYYYLHLSLETEQFSARSCYYYFGLIHRGRRNAIHFSPFFGTCEDFSGLEPFLAKVTGARDSRSIYGQLIYPLLIQDLVCLCCPDVS